ncbi:acyl-CoA dehydrogenase family protein [Actinospongicola halichondriae]|uniref:acyl-CoA dehydrogenase family protein n=1 Tax=Actinospongicola halichondriae TaxID=3236844 RepID=UPI003D55E645
MDFLLSDDQLALQSELRRFLTDRVDHDLRTAAAELPGAVDRSLWSELASMGVFGIHTAEADGGVGLGLAEATIVFEELGRVAMPGPTISTCLAATLGAEGAIDGSAVVGLIRADTLLVEHLDGLDTLLVHHDGLVEHVETPEGMLLPRPLDPLTPVSQVDAIPAGDEISNAGERVIREGRLLAAAFQVGLGQAAVDLGTEYAGQRQQFGKVIGSFQAVKHLLADAVVAVDIARAGVHAAAVALDEDSDSDARVMSVDAARLVASEAAQRACEACIQVHGGIGFTWELDAHLFLKRSLALDATFGTVHASHDAVAATL